MISSVEAMSHFSGNLNRPLKPGTTQGFGPTSGWLALSSTLPIVAPFSITVVGVLPVVARLPASLINQDRGAGRQSAQTLVNKRKQQADESLQRKRKCVASIENNEFEA